MEESEILTEDSVGLGDVLGIIELSVIGRVEDVSQVSSLEIKLVAI